MQVLQGGHVGRELRVLVADDDPVMRALVRANLKGRLEDVTEAADGQIAWDLLLGSTFDLALIDLSMPGIDGFTLIRCIRSHPRTRHLPIVVITSSTDRAAVTQALEVGATSFLTKPINWNLFAHQIDCLIRTDESRSLDRATRQRAEAVARAKDAVIATLAARVRLQARRMIEMSESRMRAPGDTTCTADFAAGVMLEALEIVQVVEDVLPHVRSMTEEIVVDDRPVPVGRILQQCAAAHVELAAEAGVQLQVNGADSSLRVRCDEIGICRALSNLLRNAIEFTRPGSCVSIALEHRPDNALAIVVEDEGPGVDPEVIARCMAPLDRRSETADAGERPALGLPIARAIAQAHGGTVEVVARVEVGTRALLVLPSEIVETLDIEDAA